MDVEGDGTDDFNGSAVPAVVEHTYAQPGTYTARLNVSDGELHANASVTIVVQPAGPKILYLVGDGSTTVVTNPSSAQANTGQPFLTNFGLASTGNANKETTYYVLPSGNPALAYNYQIPSFVGNEKVNLSGGPIKLHVFLATPCQPNEAANTYPMHAALFTKAGTQVGGLAAAYPKMRTTTPTELVFTLTPPAGVYDGLLIQYGKSATSSPTSPCLPFITKWGTAAYNARLVLGDADRILPAA